MTIEAKQLVGKWVHSHEEDKGNERVFRPVGFALPPSRGRRALDLRSDGTAIDGRIGADDRADMQQARWNLKGGDTLHISAGGKSQKLHVVQALPDKLVVTDA